VKLLAFVEGRNPVIEAIKNNREIDKIMIANSAKEGSIKKIIGMAKEKNLVIQYVEKQKLDEISESHAHQGVIAQVSEYKYADLDEVLENVKSRGEDPFFIILDEINDPHNLGSIIRTADAVGAHGVMDGDVFYEQNMKGPLGLVIGSEGYGISRLVKENCDFKVKMPMVGNVTSLNASVAGSIVLYEVLKQRLGK